MPYFLERVSGHPTSPPSPPLPAKKPSALTPRHPESSPNSDSVPSPRHLPFPPRDIVAANLAPSSPEQSFSHVLTHAGTQAIKSGAAGAGAMAGQVILLMAPRTAINGQYATGLSFMKQVESYWKEGGLPRFYKGFSGAIIIGPLYRAGDAFGNTLASVALGDANLEMSPLLRASLVTAAGSAVSAANRVLFTPIELVLKTGPQVIGISPIKFFRDKISHSGIPGLWHGAMPSASRALLGNVPWFWCNNILEIYVPTVDRKQNPLLHTLRNGAIGGGASAFTELCLNLLNTVKVLKQTDPEFKTSTYSEIAKTMIKREGFLKFYTRGLWSKMGLSVLTGTFFKIFWSQLESFLGVETVKKK